MGLNVLGRPRITSLTVYRQRWKPSAENVVRLSHGGAAVPCNYEHVFRIFFHRPNATRTRKTIKQNTHFDSSPADVKKKTSGCRRKINHTFRVSRKIVPYITPTHYVSTPPNCYRTVHAVFFLFFSFYLNVFISSGGCVVFNFDFSSVNSNFYFQI